MTPIDYNNPNDYWNGYDPCKGMTEKERIKTALAYMVVYFIFFAIAVLLCALLSGCTTTKYVPVVEHRTDTVRITQHQRDSIYVHDSTYVSDKGDTVLIERWHTRWRDRWQHDTLYISKRDSIPVPYPVTKEVPAPLSWWQQARIYLADAVLVAVVLLLVFVVIRRKFF